MEHTSATAASMERLDSKQKTTSVVQEAGQGDDIDDQSPFSAAQMLASLPSLILIELFDHLDLRQAARFVRVSSSWAEEMQQIPKRNNGIAVLIAGGIAAPLHISVSHLILVSNVGKRHEGIELFSFPSMKKMTVNDGGFNTVYAVASVAKSLSSSCVEVVRYRPWKLQVIIEFYLAEAPEQVKRLFAGEVVLATTLVKFTFFIDCPYFEVSPTDSLTDAWSENVERVWRLLDAHSLLWPYPPEQLEWLLVSLDNLKEEMLETVKFLDAGWISAALTMIAHVAGRSRRAECDEQSYERRLDSLDLAFLGRLLVFLDRKEKIPGQNPPPYAFSSDLW